MTTTLPPRTPAAAAPARATPPPPRARTARPALPRIPWRHSDVFAEPRYSDGQPWHDETDDEDDE